MDLQPKTIAATTTVNISTYDGLEYLEQKCKEISGIQFLRAKQIASNMYEAELYLEDITDLWLLGLAVGRKFPKTE